ncbi:DUF4346 domain-containing protein [Candidatus Altiarchaeota archaeon]
MKEEDGLELDPKGFFVIDVDNNRKKIVVQFFGYNRKLKEKFSSSSAEKLCKEILEKELVSNIQHAAYIGRELVKAEVALNTGKKYVQDESLEFCSER